MIPFENRSPTAFRTYRQTMNQMQFAIAPIEHISNVKWIISGVEECNGNCEQAFEVLFQRMQYAYD